MSDYNFLKGSDGTGLPVLAHITADRAAAATVIETDNLDNWPDEFIVTTGTIGSDGFLDPDTVTEMTGHKDGTDIVIDGFEPGFSDVGNEEDQVAMVKQTAGWADSMVENAQVSHNDDGTIKTAAVTTAMAGKAAIAPFWESLSAAPNTITYNGNHSYDLVFNSLDLTGVLTPGMRLKGTRTVSAPTQCADLEASSSQYLSKASPAGMAWTDDFAAGAAIPALESYAEMGIISKYNGTSGWLLYLNASGQVILQGVNAGVGNYSRVVSKQSIPLGKKVVIAAQLDMSAFTATTTTSYIMIDGVDVPAIVERGGTNPTALIQAGNLNVGAFNAGSFFDGKLAQVWVSSGKITQANVRTIQSQGITSAEVATHSLASAFSLSNSLTDLNTTSANNLTANGGATTTTADSIFAVGADGVPTGTTDYGIVQKVSISGGNTTVVVQVPDGNAFPTSGGISAMAYSGVKVPLGFVANKSRWRIEALYPTTMPLASPTGSQWNHITGVQLSSVPVGEFLVGYSVSAASDRGAAGRLDASVTLSTANNTEGDYRLSGSFGISSANTIAGNNVKNEAPIAHTAATTYYINTYFNGGGGARTTMYLVGSADQGRNILYAENGYL